MKNLIRVEDAKLYLAKNYIGGKKSLGQCLDEVPTVNAIEIPENPTNGDMVKAIFPDTEIEGIGDEGAIQSIAVSIGYGTSYFALDWWNAPYKKGE